MGCQEENKKEQKAGEFPLELQKQNKGAKVYHCGVVHASWHSSLKMLGSVFVCMSMLVC